jgi:hypothetical protein
MPSGSGSAALVVGADQLAFLLIFRRRSVETSAQRGIGVLLFVELAPDIGPEFLRQKAQSVIAQLGTPDGHHIPHVAVLPWVICVGGNGRRATGAENLGVVEFLGAGIGTGDEDAGHGGTRLCARIRLWLVENTGDPDARESRKWGVT